MNTTTVGGVRITCHGHSSVSFEYGGLIVYVDPYVLPRGAKPADLVLHTHGHFDHCAEAKSILKPNTTLIASPSCKHPGQSVSPGQSFKLGSITIQAVQAYNPNKQFHPRGIGVGYILTFGSAPAVRVYVAGDTDRIEEMKDYKCEVAILPIGGTYTMDMAEAAAAVGDIKPKVVIPYHYNYLADLRIDPAEFKRLVAQSSPNTDVRILL
ncbi:MAG: MBL fold metallo-hydrolase [Candidatus Marsarchaeota archaeon]|nr:MBL fold metallo-hydrolase [Candidatus Marsarchaeota archaeon]